MANDADSEQFANVTEARSQTYGSYRRIRPNKKPRKTGLFNVEPNSAVKHNEEVKSEAVDKESRTLNENKEPRTGFVPKTTSTSEKDLSMKLKDLLASGILEGMTVKYVRRMEAKHGDTGLEGVIRSNEIVCSCKNCNRVKRVGATTFEQHAGSASKRPAQNIQLLNGNTLQHVMNTCSNTPLAHLEEAVQIAIGLTLRKSTICFNCKGRFEDINVVSKLLCNTCTNLKDKQPRPTQQTENNNMCVSQVVQSRSPKLIVLPKLKNSGMKQSTSRGKNQPKVTKKDLRMHKFVFEEGVLDEGAELSYRVRGQKRLVGRKEGNGIRCCCCDSVVSPSQFEAHAGYASRRKPYVQIYTSDGVSLHQLSITHLKERRISVEDHDDVCTMCQDGGNMLCCVSCPRVFHIGCVPLPGVPSGSWHCRYCQNLILKEKHRRSTRRVEKTNEGEHGGCTLCSGQDFNEKYFGPRTVIICDQCEREYHVGCLKDHNMQSLEKKPRGNWFCCSDCDQIHTTLENLVARGEQNLPDYLLSLIKKNYEGKDIELDIKWRLLNRKLVDSNEINSLFPKVVAIFHEEFDPIVDPTTDLDFIVQMIYGRSIVDHDFRGIYCAVLIVNQEVVCSGILRVFGKHVAELPLVATKSDFQGQGYFRTLFSCIERVLEYLKVKNFVLPAAKEAEVMWTDKFGFTRLDKNQINEYKKYYPMVAFEGTSLLQKHVPVL